MNPPRDLLNILQTLGITLNHAWKRRSSLLHEVESLEWLLRHLKTTAANRLRYNNAKAATAAPTAPIFEPKIWAAPDALVVALEVDAVVDDEDPGCVLAIQCVRETQTPVFWLNS